jgi:hypothetical protein
VWNTKCEHFRNKVAPENALQESVKELNFSEITVEEIKTMVPN